MTLARACRLASIAFILVLACYPLRPADLLPQTPMTEDGFYTLSIARQVAAGRGISYDGVHPTDGVQPAVLLLDAPAFLVTSDPFVIPQRIVFAIELVLFVVSALVCGAVAHRLAPDGRGTSAAVAGLWWLSSFPIFRHSFNGLETGLYLLGQLLVLLWILRNRARLLSPSGALRLGLFLGALTLVRVDAGVLVAAIAFAYVARWGHPLPLAGRLRLAATFCGAAALVAGGWFVRSFVLFGSVMPSSGAAQSIAVAPLVNLQRWLSAISQPFFPALLPVGLRFSWPGILGWLVALAICWALVWRIARARVPATPDAWFPFWCAGAGWSCFYVFGFGAPHFLDRYLVPLAVPIVPLLAVALARALDGERRHRHVVGAAWALALAVALAEHWIALSGSTVATRNWNYLAQYRVLVAPLPSSAVVGAGQSGTLGFFHPGTVNLDGKVNHEALAARRAGELWRYVDGSDIEYLVDWPSVVNEALGARKSQWLKVGEAQGYEAWRRASR